MVCDAQKLRMNATVRALLLAAIGLSAVISPARAASLAFVPAGSQLDADPIDDIATEVGEVIAFDVLLDTTGLGSTGLLDISYGFTWDSGRSFFDPGELERQLINDDVDFGPSNRVFCAISAAICGAAYSDLSLNQQGTLTRITFDVLPELTNDGASDFDIQIDSATLGGVDVTSQFIPASQEVEVQPIPEPTSSSLGLFALGSIGVASAILRKKRRIH